MTLNLRPINYGCGIEETARACVCVGRESAGVQGQPNCSKFGVGDLTSRWYEIWRNMMLVCLYN